MFGPDMTPKAQWYQHVAPYYNRVPDYHITARCTASPTLAAYSVLAHMQPIHLPWLYKMPSSTVHYHKPVVTEQMAQNTRSSSLLAVNRLAELMPLLAMPSATKPVSLAAALAAACMVRGRS